MSRTYLSLLLRIRAAMSGNRLIYWLNRVPLLNKLFTERLYSAEEGKLVFSLLGSLFGGVTALFRKLLYLVIIFVVGLMAANCTPFTPQAFSLSVWVFFWLSMVAGTMLQPTSVAPSPFAYACVRLMGMDAAKFQTAQMVWEHLAAFIQFIPLLLGWSALCGVGFLPGLLLSLALAMLRVIAEWVHLTLFARFHVIPSGKISYLFPLVVGCLAVAYVPALLRVVPNLAVFLLSPITLAVLLGLALVCARAIARYPHHYALILTTCQQSRLLGQEAKKQAQRQQFHTVKLQDSDLDARADFSRLHGWHYLQSVFFHRHRRMLLKPFYILTAILAGGDGGGVCTPPPGAG